MLIYKCDGCGLEEKVIKPDSFPAGWREPMPTMHVCPECFDRQAVSFALGSFAAAVQWTAELSRIMGFGPPSGGGQKGPRKRPRKRQKTKILEGEILAGRTEPF